MSYLVRIGTGTLNKEQVRITFHHKATSPNALLGCHSFCVPYFGRASIQGIMWGNHRVGEVNAAEGNFAELGPTPDPPAGLPGEVIQDIVYSKIAATYANTGVIIFSDRINRGTPASPSTAGMLYAGREYTCATLAKWLSKHPELGTLTASPAFNNPNYQLEGNYGICQVWCWFPKGRNMYTDEALGFIGPDIILPRGEFENTAYERTRRRGYDRVTYDEATGTS